MGEGGGFAIIDKNVEITFGNCRYCDKFNNHDVNRIVPFQIDIATSTKHVVWRNHEFFG